LPLSSKADNMRANPAVPTMKITPLLHAIVFCGLVVSGYARAAVPSEAATKAADSCEAAVADTIKEMRGREAHEILFQKDKRVLLPTTGEETDVKGAGRYRSAAGATMPFTYGCAYNGATGGTSGIVFRDANARPSDEKPWQPDMVNVSPEACEAAVAAALKSKHPRVGVIAFGSDSRQLRPAPAGRSSLEGVGAVQRAPGMNQVAFKYRCEFEPGNGKLVAVQTFE
jgi:hypothetical protein